MANAILHTRMSFFETNPMGRILNRLSSDVRECDRDVYDTMTPLCELLISVSVSSLTSMILRGQQSSPFASWDNIHLASEAVQDDHAASEAAK